MTKLQHRAHLLTRRLGAAKKRWGPDSPQANALRARRAGILQEILAQGGPRGFIRKDGTLGWIHPDDPWLHEPQTVYAKKVLYGPSWHE